MADERPIGIFDSGVGGLTVLRAIQGVLPRESVIYLGDLARCPYGTRPQAEVRAFALQIGDRLANLGIKALVVACNTATAAAYTLLHRRYSFPVLGVIEPGAAAAVAASSNGRIGVIATEGTVRSHAYRQAIESLRPGTLVLEKPASWLVPVLERGEYQVEAIRERLSPLLQGLRQAEVDTLVLGCTHFPLVKPLFAELIGPEVTVLDSADTAASALAHHLREGGLEARGPSQRQFLVTGPPAAFARTAQAMFGTAFAVETVRPIGAELRPIWPAVRTGDGERQAASG